MIYEPAVVGGAEFDGLTADTGLLEFPEQTTRVRRVRIDSILFHTDGAISTWTLSIVRNGVVTKMATGTQPDYVALDVGPLPNYGSQPPSLRFVTTGMDDDATLVIGWDYETEDTSD